MKGEKAGVRFVSLKLGLIVKKAHWSFAAKKMDTIRKERGELSQNDNDNWSERD